MLTKKQHQLLLFIRDRVNRDGVAPSFDEMKEALKLQSKSGIHRLIMALEERGFLRRLPHRARALAVIKVPDNMVERVPGAPRSRIHPQCHYRQFLRRHAGRLGQDIRTPRKRRSSAVRQNRCRHAY